MTTKDQTILIPGGEVTLIPESIWITPDKKEIPIGKKIRITFGKQTVTLRPDQFRALIEVFETLDDVRRHVANN